jgi:hypothetical protein
MKLSFDGTLDKIAEEMRAFLAEMDGDNDGDAAEAATGTAPRKRKTKAEKEAEKAAAAAAQAATPNANIPAPGATGFGMTQPQAGFTPPQGAQTGFAAPQAAAGQQAPFGAPAAAPVTGPSPLVQAFIDKTEASVAAGQPAETAVGWWRQFLGPDAAQADWPQIKGVFLPRVPEANLKAIAGQFGIAV